MNRKTKLAFFCSMFFLQLLWGDVCKVYAQESGMNASNSYLSESRRSEYFHQQGEKPSQEYIDSQTSWDSIWNSRELDGIRNTYNNTVNGIGNTYQNAKNGISNFWNSMFPDDKAKEDMNTMLGPTSTLGGSTYMKPLESVPGAGKVVSPVLDFFTTEGDLKATFLDGGHKLFQSDTLNSTVDALRMAHFESNVAKYAAIDPETKVGAESASMTIGIVKDTMSTHETADAMNELNEAGFNPFIMSDMFYRGYIQGPTMIFNGGLDFSDDFREKMQAYLIYTGLGQKEYQKYVDNVLAGNERAGINEEDEDYAYAKAKAEAARARAKAQGQKNQAAQNETPDMKPNIYIYPEEETIVTLTFDHSEYLTKVIPQYKDRWEVKASPDGTLTDSDGKEYGFLFYESEAPDALFQRTESFYLPSGDRVGLLQKLLKAYGMNDIEIRDFVEFWDAKLEKDVDYLMYPQTTGIIDEVMPVEILPEPDHIFRIWFVYRQLDEVETMEVLKAQYGEVQEISDQVQVTSFRRDGNTVVEWGGLFW